MKSPGLDRRLRATVAVLAATVLSVGALGAAAAPAPSPPPALSLQQIFQQSAPAVVLIVQFDASGKPTALGSGFVVSSSGVIVTNNHVIAPYGGAVRIAVKLPRGDVYTDVRVIYAEERRDFAVLLVKAVGLPTLKVGDSDTVQVGDQVVAIGNPEGLELTFTSGIVSNIRPTSEGFRFIQHQAPISHGSSGGPLLNIRGEVIGINTFSLGGEGAQNLNGAIPINYVKPYFGDTARLTWQEYAHVSATAPPSQPAQAPSPAAPPVAAPPAPARPGAYFVSAMAYRRASPETKLGFNAGVSDTVALLAEMAREPNLDSQVLALFQCLNGQSDTAGQLRDWLDAVFVRTLIRPNEPVVEAVAVSACRLSFSGNPSVYESFSSYQRRSDAYRLGFVEGLFDATSVVAEVAQGAEGIDSRTMRALPQCLDSHGDTLGAFTSWVDTVMAGSSPDNSAVEVVLRICLP